MERELSHTLPEDSFVTCSSDDTIRVWGLEGCANNEIYRKNIYSKELLKVVYIDDDLNYIKDLEIVGDKGGASSNSNYDGRNGVRCIKISPELEHLASGDRSGNIRIYNLNNLKLITAIEAHESEVLCLEYSNEKIDRKLLASASRDRLIHVFDVAQDYKLLQTLDDHSSSITSIKFVGAGLNFQMISCGADKSIMFRTFQVRLIANLYNKLCNDGIHSFRAIYSYVVLTHRARQLSTTWKWTRMPNTYSPPARIVIYACTAHRIPSIRKPSRVHIPMRVVLLNLVWTPVVFTWPHRVRIKLWPFMIIIRMNVWPACTVTVNW